MSLFGSEAVGALARYRLSGNEVDLQRVQSALRESDEWWDALFNVAGVGMMFGTLEGEILAVTPSLETIFGYPEEELKEVGPAGVTHPDDLQTDLQLFGELVEGKREYYQLDKRYLRKDGSLMWGRLTVVLLRDESGQPRFAAAMVEDTTSDHQASEYESRLREAELYKRQALELNDEVLQELVVAKLAFDSGATAKGQEALSSSLAHLKQVIDHMLAHGESLAPGDFVRGHLLLEHAED